MDPRTALNIPHLDGWRGLAILCLLVGHFFPIPGMNLGAVGVNLFFVLSGFLMARILFIKPVPIPVFYKRRISRVFPSMYVFIAAVVAAYPLLDAQLGWTEILAAATFTTNYFPGEPGAAVMPFGHIWSLAVEEHSYVLLSLVAIAARAGRVKARTAVGLMALASAAFGAWYWLTYPRTQVAFDRWLHTEVSAFGIFAAAWFLLFFDGKRLRRVPMLAFVALVCAGLAAHWWWVPLPVRTVIGVGAFALAVNVVHMTPQAVRAALANPLLRHLGLWSFSLYLWQQPFYLLVWRGHIGAWTGMVLALGCGLLSYYLLERPVRAWLNQRWAVGRKSERDPEPTAAPAQLAS